jgi:hypothetical protein
MKKSYTKEMAALAVAALLAAPSAYAQTAYDLTQDPLITANADAIAQEILDAAAADAAIQADVDQNESDSDAADAAIQADVDQNESDSDAADAAIQADVDQNESDSDAADAAIQADVDQEIADRSELISDEGPNADGNQVVHIGDNSLITEELGDTQRLRAEDGSGDNIDIRFDGEAGVIVDNFLEVTAPDEEAVFETDTSGAGSMLPTTGEPSVGSTPVATVLGTTTGVEVANASGGVLLENNGNVTLSQSGGTESTVEFLQVVTFDVANPGEPGQGLPIDGTERYVAGYENLLGEFVAISDEFLTQGDLDDWIAETDIDDEAYDDVRESQELAGTGGNLEVGGNANVDGVLSLGDNGSGAVSDVAAAIWGNSAGIITERNRAIAAEGVLQNNIDINSGAIANNSSRIKSNKDDIDENRRGIAMVAALQHTTVLPGMTNALDVSAAHFDGETGMALNYARRINENWQINFGAASTTDFDESVIKAGVGVQW